MCLIIIHRLISPHLSTGVGDASTSSPPASPPEPTSLPTASPSVHPCSMECPQITGSKPACYTARRKMKKTLRQSGLSFFGFTNTWCCSRSSSSSSSSSSSMMHVAPAGNKIRIGREYKSGPGIYMCLEGDYYMRIMLIGGGHSRIKYFASHPRCVVRRHIAVCSRLRVSGYLYLCTKVRLYRYDHTYIHTHMHLLYFRRLR